MKSWLKDTRGYRVFTVCNVILMALLMALFLFPYLHTMAKAFNDSADTARGGVTIWPRKFSLDNFRTLLSDSLIVSAAVVSVLRVVAGTAVGLLTQFLAAYGFTKKEFVGRSQLLVFLTIPMFIGGGLIPQYILYSQLKLLNTFWVYILPGAFSLYNMVIIRTYINTIPASLEESAKLDGANEFVIFARIIIPLSMPILATIALWLAVDHWNNWTSTLYFVTQKRLFTLQYVLVQVLKETERIQSIMNEARLAGETIEYELKSTPEAIQSAQIILTTVPIVMVYPFLQKYFIKGITLGAIKD